MTKGYEEVFPGTGKLDRIPKPCEQEIPKPKKDEESYKEVFPGTNKGIKHPCSEGGIKK